MVTISTLKSKTEKVLSKVPSTKLPNTITTLPELQDKPQDTLFKTMPNLLPKSTQLTVVRRSLQMPRTPNMMMMTINSLNPMPLGVGPKP